MDYKVLKMEIAGDPKGLGYAGKTDAQIADLLNAAREEAVPRGLVAPTVLLGDLFDVVVGLRQLPDDTAVPNGVPSGMTVPVLKQLLSDIKYVDPINMQATTPQQFLAVLAAYGLMGSADTATARIGDVSTIAVSRAEKLLGRGAAVTAEDVRNGRMGEW